MNSPSPALLPRLNHPALSQALRHAGILAALVAAAAVSPAQASESNAAPIEIRSCTPIYTADTENVYALGMATAAGIQIDFVNHTAIPAEDVTFQVGTAGATTMVADRGSFAPGVLVRHVFWTGTGVDTSACSVAAARFAGGAAYAASAPEAAGANR